jgi:uncharacterized Zn finger protein
MALVSISSMCYFSIRLTFNQRPKEAVEGSNMKNSKLEFFRILTWSDIQTWAGDTISSRGQSYQHSRVVRDLALTPYGGLVAWVQGTERYATKVDIEDEELTSDCTCPYGGTCKHAVAVVLDYLEKLKQNLKVPTVSEKDKRLLLLSGEMNDALEDDFDDEDDSDQEETRSEITLTSRKGKDGSDSLHSKLKKQGKEQLITLLETIAEHYPSAKVFLIDHFQLALGKVEKLVLSTRKEIDRISAEPGWRNSWNGEGETPEYSEVRHRLEMLLSQGHADEVIGLGKRLLEAGTSQVEQSDDEGETQDEIASCMDMVFEALSQTSLSPAEQMLWAVEADLADEYDLTAGSDVFWEQKHPPADWSILADILLNRLKNPVSAKREDQFSRNYHRDRFTDWTIKALDNSGRQEEIMPILKQEAVGTGSYVRLVNRLIQDGNQEEAEKWIQRGIKATQHSSPGIASQLRDILRKIRERQGDWLSAAAFRSDDFFVRPEIGAFKALQEAAESAGVWPAVRAAVMYYLESGALPQKAERIDKDQTIPSWPLPETGLRENIDSKGRNFPLVGTLLDIAIEEKRPEKVLRWYDYSVKGQTRDFWRWSNYGKEDKVAEAIKEAYPERAIVIWKKLAENQIGLTKPKAYDQAGICLNKLKRLYNKQGKESEWRSYLNNLRSANIRKTRFLEVLNRLSAKPIVETG